jgi:hypothetical protein
MVDVVVAGTIEKVHVFGKQKTLKLINHRGNNNIQLI